MSISGEGIWSSWTSHRRWQGIPTWWIAGNVLCQQRRKKLHLSLARLDSTVNISQTTMMWYAICLTGARTFHSWRNSGNTWPRLGSYNLRLTSCFWPRTHLLLDLEQFCTSSTVRGGGKMVIFCLKHQLPSFQSAIRRYAKFHVFSDISSRSQMLLTIYRPQRWLRLWHQSTACSRDKVSFPHKPPYLTSPFRPLMYDM